jgi:hypothetical protein
MNAWRIGVGVLAALALRVDAQVVTGGAGAGYGMYPGVPLVVVPLVPYSYGYVYPDPLRSGYELPSCYRFGRCSLRDLERFRDRPYLIDRLAPAAPAAPEGGPRPARDQRAGVAPTPEENIRPEYRGASLPRAEFEASGRPR